MPTPSTPEPAALLALLREHAPPPGGRLWVAYSGGRDSTVLLHLLAGLRDALAPWQLCALHVDHGLLPEAAQWREHCRDYCARLGVPLRVAQVDAAARAGESPEAAARRARYGAFRALLEPGELLLTAHHQRDQAETVVLRALRGCGPDGLAGIPRRARLADGWLLRPLLDWSDRRLNAYAGRHALHWVQDPGNAGPRFDRSFVRTALWPALVTRWPGVAATLARLAELAREQRGATQALADLCLTLRGDAADRLPVSVLRALPTPAQALLLRQWLRRQGVRAPGRTRLLAGLDGLLHGAAGRTPLLAWGHHAIRRYRDELYLLPHPLPVVPAEPLPWCLPAGELRVPGLGTLRATPVLGHGLACPGSDPLPRLQVQFRRGGERIALASGRQDLKALFQARGIPPWQRDRWPLLLRDGICVAVPGLAVAANATAQAGEPGWAVAWNAAAPEG